MVAGETGRVRILCRDRFGNAVEPSPEISFAMSLWSRDPDSPGPDGVPRLGSPAHGGLSVVAAEWVGRGEYELRFSATAAGAYWLAAILTG